MWIQAIYIIRITFIWNLIALDFVYKKNKMIISKGAESVHSPLENNKLLFC